MCVERVGWGRGLGGVADLQDGLVGWRSCTVHPTALCVFDVSG